MATLLNLKPSFIQLSPQDQFDLIRTIRENRRRRPEKKMRDASKTARQKRAPSKKSPRQSDLFALAKGMTSQQKAALAAELLGGMIDGS